MMNMLQHLHDRHYDTAIHKAWWDDEEEVATFPLWNLSGTLVGYQRYRPKGDKKRFNNPYEGKYFTRLKDQKVGVWGLESWQFTDPLFITEGVFDASRLTWYGYSAIALATNDASQQLKNWLWTVRQMRPVVALCDGDKSGMKLAKHGHTYIQMPEDQDVGSLSFKQFVNLQKQLNKFAL